MKTISFYFLVATISLFILLAPANAVVIDFESTGLPEGEVLTTQIPGLSFGGTAVLAAPGDPMFAFAGTLHDTAASPFDAGFFISDALVNGDPFQYAGPIVVEFQNTVSDLSFTIADLEGTEVMTATLFDSNNNLIETVIEYGNSSPFGNGTAVPIPFTGSNVKRLEIEVVDTTGIPYGWGIDNLSFTPTPEPPTFPDDTMPPCGSVHAYPNIIWPPNNKMVSVALYGCVVDEMSIARDGNGIGISSAYLLIDGNEMIPLLDGSTNLLDAYGCFSVDFEVEATKGNEYDIRLYAADTEPQAAGGPNSGLVDSTYVIVPLDMKE